MKKEISDADALFLGLLIVLLILGFWHWQYAIVAGLVSVGHGLEVRR